MKKSTLFLLSVIFAFSFVSTSVNAQIEIERPQIPNIFPEIEMPNFKFSDGTYVIDTVVTYNDYGNNRYSFSYNENGRLLIQTNERFVDNNWEYISRSTRTYNENDKLLQVLWENWEENDWVDIRKWVYTYNENDNIISLYDSYLSDNIWKDSKRYFNIYDDDENRIESKSEEYINEEWQIDYQQFFTYDENGFNNSITTQVFYGGNLIGKDRSTFSNDINGNILVWTTETWEYDSWEYSSKYTMTYNEQGSELSCKFESYFTEQWVNCHLDTQTYDENENYLTGESAIWENNDWQIRTRFSCTYDENDNQLSSVREYYINSIWVIQNTYSYNYSPEGYILSRIYYDWTNEECPEISRIVYENDDFGNTIAVDSYEWIEGSWISKSDLVTIYYNDGNNLRAFNGYRVEVHYSTLSGIDEITNNIFSDIYCSPNPANNYSIVNINLSDNINADISLFDIQGNKLKDIYKGKLQKGQHQFNVNFENLSAGVYFVKLTSGKSSETLKIVHTR